MNKRNQPPNKIRIINSDFQPYQIGDRVFRDHCTDDTGAYTWAYGIVLGVIQVPNKALSIDSQWGQTGYYFYVLFDRCSDDRQYAEFEHESTLVREGREIRLDDPWRLFKLLMQSISKRLQIPSIKLL